MHLLELVGRASRDRPGRSIVAAIGRRQIFGDETAGVTRRAIDDKVEVPLHDVGPPRDPGSYLQIRAQSLCTLRGHCRQGPRNIRYQAGATPLPGALIRSPRRRGRAAPKRWGCQAILCRRGARRGHEAALTLDLLELYVR